MYRPGDPDPRTYGNPQGELTTYREYLQNYRLTVEMKVAGLSTEQLAARSVPPSTMSLLGLVRHLSQVENHWFQRVLQGRTDVPCVYKSEDDFDLDFTGAVAEDAVVQDAFATWQREIALGDEYLDTQSDATMGVEVAFGDGGETVSVRDVLVHVVEEYARHAGHADLLRECIDGTTGM